ncbi:transcription factor Spi-C [Eptesicus fuscus]|uniref:transcription factor Spi-C n=1 Tax=Eptesicus fuscus TaxID=29078 RepID=UPI002403C33E|nr:transcription factor Spi-C [Eptesicus fuscus]
MKRLSAFVDRQRQAPASAATLLDPRCRHLRSSWPPVARRRFPWKPLVSQQLPRRPPGVGGRERPRRDCATEGGGLCVRVVAFDAVNQGRESGFLKQRHWTRAPTAAASQELLVLKRPAGAPPRGLGLGAFSDDEALGRGNNNRGSPLPPMRRSLRPKPPTAIFGVAVPCTVSFRSPAPFRPPDCTPGRPSVIGSVDGPGPILGIWASVEQDRLGQAFEDAFDVLRQHSAGDLQYPPDCKDYVNVINHCSHVIGSPSYYGLLPSEQPVYNWKTVINHPVDLRLEGNIHPSLQNIPENHVVQYPVLQQKGGKGRKKLRLFEYLHESLCNPEMASCIQWVDKTKGIFQFVSKNKEKLAQLWGKRKGNRKTMTYQKMARALRNYGRTGEITKIRRKLTYQFNEAILQRLSPSYFLEKEIYSQYVQPGQGYLSLNSWNANCNYTYANYYELSYPNC